MKQIFILLIAAICFSFSGTAQNIVSGTIIDDQGLPIPGVNILEKNTTNGYVSDFDGNFTMTVKDNAILVFSYIGYKTQEIAVNGKTTIPVKMITDNAELDEVVVIGYGAVSRDKITSSIATIKADEIAKVVASNPAEALQGKAAGVQVLSNGGAPGAAPRILIRGVTTFNGSTQPLLVLDGVLLPASTSLNFINPLDIESIQVLKDAAASAIYGSRASNGVLLITTKRGKTGKAKISLSASYGVQNTEKFETADAQEYIQVFNTRRLNDDPNADPSTLINPEDFGEGTDWWDEVIENNSPITNINLRASGGSENIKYSGSLSYFDQKSNVGVGSFERINGRFNTDFKISDKLSLKQDFSARIQYVVPTPGVLFNALRIDPTTDVFIPFSERVDRNEFSIFDRSTNLVPNPVGQLARSFANQDFNEFFTNTQLDYKIIPNFKFTTQFGLTLSTFRQKAFNPQFFIDTQEQNEVNQISERIDQSLGYVFNNTITFDKTILDKHYLNITGGILYDSEQTSFVSASRDGLPSDTDPNLRQITAATGETIQVGGNEGTDNILSGIFRTIYAYDNRYFFTGSVRVDESSRFAEGNRTGIFSSASFAWDVDSEKFFKSDVINNLRFKVAAGEVGNQNINRNGQFFSVGNDNFVFGSERVRGNILSRFGNPDLRWETVKDKNFGVDLGILNNTFTLSAEYYIKTSEDLLFDVNLPNFTGIPGRVAQNVGSFESRGFDLQLGYNKQIKDFSIGVDVTLSTNESRAVDLAPGNEVLFGASRARLGGSFVKITELDEIIGLFQGFKTNGIFQNQTELNSHTTEDGTLIQPDAQVGDLRFVDQNNDGNLNDDDVVTIGNPFPDFYGNVNVNLRYKKVDFSMQWYASVGNDVYNGNREYIISGTQGLNVQAGLIDQVWSPTNTNAEFPRLTNLDPNGNYRRVSDLFIEDGSYLRLRNIQLGYSLDIKGFNQFRVFVSGQNLLTFTKYTGFDPEVSSGNNVINQFGLDFGRTPVARTVLLGLNLTL